MCGSKNCSRKEQKLKISDLGFHFRKLENEKQTQSKKR